ncbi:protein odr-4 homolog isoform X3 [Gopherus flavomarginatus]|uniref:protein odr-4 homolog isoform X3 n=1 Tax=Gopherus flavomarginatus TaxID=286002 RepID=UPI0021CBE8FC|nr:protein odr-4 homolog isoform X3 [Gopherus flavomarginatus]
MGRSYFVEEAVGQYLSEFSTKPKACVTGLLIGQCSPQRDYVILAIRTPLREEQNERNKNYHPKLADIDEEWVTGHASQLSRMLPGGLLVLGVFIVAAPELAKDIQNALRKLVFSVEKSIGKKRLWNFAEDEVSDRVALHLCSATKKILCRTYDMQDPKSSAKPADWKYQSGLSAFWLSLECTINVNIHIPLSATSVNYELEKYTRNGLTRWAKQIEEGVFLINGQAKDDDAELLEGQKKSSRGNIQHSTQPFDVKVLMQLALKRDIINTLSDRCEILFEDLLINEAPEKKNSEREYHALPHRVFASIAGSNVMLCDYKFGDETAGEIQERFFEMLDQVVHGEAIHIAEEINIVAISPLVDNTDDTQQMQLTKATLLLKFQQNMGVVIAAAVAIFAVAFSFNYFSD